MKIKIAAFVTVPVMLAMVGNMLLNRAAAQQPFNLNQAKTKQVKRVTLAHPVSLTDALNVLQNTGDQEQEIRLVGNNVLGGFRPNVNKSIDSQVQWAESAFQQRYHMIPAVSGIDFNPGTPQTTINTVKSKLAKSTMAQLNTASSPVGEQKISKQAATRVMGPLNAQNIPSYFPTTFWGEAYDSGDGSKGYSYWIDYLDEWGFSGDPASFPDDWGLELGFTSYNSTITGITRPLCGPGGNTRFWSSTYSGGYVWMAYDVPESAAPYADYNIDTDSCQENSVEIGYGYPQNIPLDQDLNITLELEPGSESGSPASAAAIMVSNDCNDVGAWPGTNCMGLDVFRQIPDGYQSPQLYVNRDRNWTIPGCMAMQDQMEAPNLSCD